MDKFLKYLPLASLVTILGMAAGFFSWALKQSGEWEQMKQRLHSDPHKVIKAEQHIDNVEEDFKQRMEFQMHLDEMTHELTETAKALREQRSQDSVIRMRDAVTNYQTKQQVDTLVKFWKEYNANTKK